MELPLDIKLIAEEKISKYDFNLVKENALTLANNYIGESGQGKSLINDELSAWIYVVTRMSSTFSAISDVLKYVKEYFNKDIRSVLDVGSGTGASSWAAYYSFFLEEINCLEKDKNMILVGQELMKSDKEINQITNWKEFDITKDEIDISSDLVIASYVFNEMEPNTRKTAIEKMWDATKEIMVIVEPGTFIGSDIIKEIREYIILLGGYIIAPCPHMDKCPLKDDDWCHFSIRSQRSRLEKILKGGEAPYEDEKYSFVAFSKNKCDYTKARVTRHPLINKSMVSLRLCTKEGIKNIDVRKNEKEKYKIARKLKAGDSFDYE